MPLFDTPTLLAYLSAAVVLVAIPGPGAAWIVAQSAAGGLRRGLVAGLGLETATLIHAVAAGLGLSAVLATSALAFEVVKYAGAAYLVWLGIRAWRSGRPPESPLHPDAPAGSGRRVYASSIVTGLLNPKVALFFLAFLPQFVHPERGLVWLQFLVLGVLLSIIGFAAALLISLAVGRFGMRLRRGGGVWSQRVIGSLFVALGIRLALQQRG
ncbi:LysE family translocator [Marilutibacter chinensis]|uniref:LysE family translocator n=1 Tax=Marilutibacter chinensis TaxID=2912247 RepID=A0ABS9HU56_9GAMM|nr:LysE family translocator [Lysobacter chinensis]MCF7222421.1 LysE family translocator [Lysobacter chinensis]